MTEYMVALEDNNGCFVGEPEFFSTMAAAKEHGSSPHKLSAGQAVVVYRVEQEEVLQEAPETAS